MVRNKLSRRSWRVVEGKRVLATILPARRASGIEPLVSKWRGARPLRVLLREEPKERVCK